MPLSSVFNKLQSCTMSECCDNPIHLCQFPTELLIYIYKFLPAKQLTVCREVCRRWKAVIDHVSDDDNMWKKYCERDFKTLYKEAKNKSHCRLWFDIYRSLTLWGRLSDASEFRDEFCHSSVIADEIKDLVVLKNGIVSVHKRAAVVYYDINTFEMTDRNPIYGDFTRFVEYDDALIILGNHLHLRIVRKPKKCDKVSESDSSSDGELQQDDEAIFYNTKYFLTVDRDVYFLNFNNDIYHCNIDKELTTTKLRWDHVDSVIALSFYNGYLNVLSTEHNIYAYRNNSFTKLFNLESKKKNIFDCLWRYQFLENIDWRIFYIWLYKLHVTLPEGPLRYICMMKIYGDVFFIGCKNGVLLIYYKPYVDGRLDLFNHEPIKQYRFAEREDIPVLSLHPILKVDVAEIKGGHKILVAMPKKVIVMTYKHNFEVIKSKAVVPYIPPGPVVLKV